MHKVALFSSALQDLTAYLRKVRIKPQVSQDFSMNHPQTSILNKHFISRSKEKIVQIRIRFISEKYNNTPVNDCYSR